MGAILGVLRAALPWAATLLGGYFISDVYNERQKAKAAQMPANYPALIQKSLKEKGDFWKFAAIAGVLFSAVTVFLTKKLK